MTMTAKTATLAGELPDLPLAACKGQDGDRWFPAGDLERETIKALCRSCPERQPCLAWALSHAEWGVWGGTDQEERRRLRLSMGLGTPPTGPTRCTQCQNKLPTSPRKRSTTGLCADCRRRRKGYHCVVCGKELAEFRKRCEDCAHGTYTGVETHRQKGEALCGPCYQFDSRRRRNIGRRYGEVAC
jgi:WhiB family transcriptional regulator, redox-sensing transcriptional regulator